MKAYGFLCRHCGFETLEDTGIQGLSCPQCGKKDALYHDINVKGGRLDPFTGFGGYTILYFDSKGNEYCAKCAAKARDEGRIKGALSCTTFDEGPDRYCDECGETIESSYGDPDAKEE